MEGNGSGPRPASRSRRKHNSTKPTLLHILGRKEQAPRDETAFRILVVLVLVVLVVDVSLFASLRDVDDDKGSAPTGSGNNDNVNGNAGGGTSWSPIGKPRLTRIGEEKSDSEPANGVRAADLSSDVDERVRNMIDRAGITIDAKLASDLPTRDDLTSMYGEEPVIYGLDTCEAFRNTVPKEQALVAVAGMFNSGTNLMAELLNLNCKIDKKKAENQDPGPKMEFMYTKWRWGMMWQVPWGKHVPASQRLINNAQLTRHYPVLAKRKEDVLPVVVVKDPYGWMGSMCRHHYQANWRHSPKHCPNLVRNYVDKRSFTDQRVGPDGNIGVNVRYPFMVTKHDSLAGLWNDWYGEYYGVTEYPRLFVRYEDLLFQPESVVAKVCRCAGGDVASGDDFRVPSDSAKTKLPVHKKASGLIEALARYGSPEKRVNGFEPEDLRYARQHLRQDLMDAFGYVYPP